MADLKQKTFSLPVDSDGALNLRKVVQSKLVDSVGLDGEDDVLAEYIVVLVSHGKHHFQAVEDLQDFLEDSTVPFVNWLWQHLDDHSSKYGVKVTIEPKATGSDPGKVNEETGRSPTSHRSSHDTVRKTEEAPAVQEQATGDQELGKPHRESRGPDSRVQRADSYSKRKSKHEESREAVKSERYPSERHKSSKGSGRERGDNSDREEHKVVSVNRAKSSHGSREDRRAGNDPHSQDRKDPSQKSSKTAAVEEDPEENQDREEATAVGKAPRLSLNLGSRLLQTAMKAAVTSARPAKRVRAAAEKELPVTAMAAHPADQVTSGSKSEAGDPNQVVKVRGIKRRTVLSASGIQLARDVLQKGTREEGRPRSGFKSSLGNSAGKKTAGLPPDAETLQVEVQYIEPGRRKELDLVGSDEVEFDFDEDDFDVQAEHGNWEGEGKNREEKLQEEESFRGRAKGGSDMAAEGREDENGAGNSKGGANGRRSVWERLSISSQDLRREGIATQERFQVVREFQGAPEGAVRPHRGSEKTEELKRRMKFMAELMKARQAVPATPRPPPVFVSREDSDARSILVSNVHFAATAEDLKSLFASCGSILRATVLLDPVTGSPNGYALMEFAEIDSVDQAVAVSGTYLMSRQLKVVKKPTSKDLQLILQSAKLTPRPFPITVRPRFPAPAFRPAVPLGSPRMQWKRTLESPSAVQQQISPAAAPVDSPSESKKVKLAPPLTDNMVRPTVPTSVSWKPFVPSFGPAFGGGRFGRSLSYHRKVDVVAPVSNPPKVE